MAISGGDGSIILTTKIDESGLNSGLSKLKSGVGAFGKAFAVAGAAGVAAFVGITKAAVDSYAEYEQLKGGVETLFKDSANTLMKYADEAYKTAGMSANQYMEGVTSFSASMIASVGGDTAKAAELSNQAMISISDNANKMGTDMESIIMTYQSLARGNVGMLDNLKLGYGGTKAELERLIADAEAYKASMGEIVDYDASNFADVTQAIQAIQEKLGIAGATALEASTTIQGSAMAMKASWQNLLTGMADPTQNFEALLQNFISSVGTFAGNLLPVVQTAAQGVLQMIQGLLPQLGNMVTQMLPMVVQGISEVLSTLYSLYPQIVQSILSILPQLIQAASQLIVQVANQLPQLMQVIVSALPTVIQSIVSVLPTIIPALINGVVQAIVILAAALPQIIQPIIDNLPMIITAITGALIANLPILIQGALQLVVALVAALPQIIMALLEAMGGIAVQIGNALFKALPGPVQDAFKAAFDAIKAIWDKVQPYFAVIWEGIKAVFSVVGAVLGGFFETAWTAIKAVWDVVTGYYSAIWDTIAGIFSVVASVLSGNWSDAWEAIKGIVNTWASFFSGVWESIKSVFSAVGSWFTNIFSTAWQGIQNVWGAVVNFFSGIWNGIVGVFSGVSSWFSSIFSSAVSGIKNVWSSITGWFSSKWVEIKNVFSDAKSKFLSIGSDIVAGIKQGISNAWGNLKSWFQGLFGDLKSIAKKILGIASPSKYFMWIAQMIVAGLTKGIDKYGKLAVRGVKELGMDVVDVFSEIIPEIADNLLKDHRTEVQKVVDESNEELLESEKLYAEESLRIEREKAEKEYEEKLKNAKNAEERQKIENERQEKLQEEANKAYLDGLKETAEKERKIFKARKKDVENLKKTIVNAYSDMATEAFDSISELQKTQESFASKLFEFGDIMEEDKFSDIHSPITEKDGRYVLENLGSQTRELERYLDLMTKLRDREEMSSELFDVIKNMGYEESFDYAKKLMIMGDKQFSNYIENWQKKQATSKRITEELFGDDGSMGAKRILSDLTAQTSVLKDYYSLLEQVKNRAELPDGFFDTLREMGIEEGLEYANSLLELSDEDFAKYISEWERKQETAKNISKALYEDEATELATSINDEFDSLKDDMFGIGKDSAGEFGDGFIQQIKFLAHDIRYALQSALGGVTIGGIGPVISGEGDVIKVPALARGGIAPRKMLAMIGERGREAVLPLENNTGWMDVLADRISARMGGASSTVVLEVDGREFGRAVVEQGNRENRRIGTRLVSR